MIYGSKEFVRARVSVTDATGKPVDLSKVPVSIRLDSGEWLVAQVVADGTAIVASLLIGPDTAAGAPAVGRHNVYVRIEDAPENPVIRAGTILVEAGG